MKSFQLIISSHVYFLLLTLSLFSVSRGSLGATPSSKDFISCLESSDINNVTSISPLVFTPTDSFFLPVWEARVNNLRFNTSSTSKPSIIITPVDENHVRTALLCTKKHGYEIRIRSGGHDFEGLSYTADVPFVMIDLSKMKSIEVDVSKKTAWVQGGVVLGELYREISQKTNTLYFPGGLCPTVSVAGFVSGGGYGTLVRKYGLGADNVVDVRFLDVKGRILDRKTMGKDLLWAIRGGRASNFGIVLAWKLRLVPVPELVTVFSMNKTLEEGATELVHKFQYVIPKIDRNLLIRVRMSSQIISNTTKKTIRVEFYGLYLGRIDALLPLLDQKFPELNVTRDICEEMRMVQSSLVIAGYQSSTPLEILTNGSSSIIKLNTKSKLDYVRTPISIRRLRNIWRKMFENDGSEFLIMVPFGGRMNDYSETAIPYPHRAGVLYQFHQLVNFHDQTSDTTPVSLQRLSWLKNLNEYIAPFVSKNPREAYINYNDLELGVGNATYAEASLWGERYWKRRNFKKLIRIKAKVDPHNFFKHPQSIPIF